MRGAGTSKREAYHFIVLPHTGIQICRGFPVHVEPGVKTDELWQLAQRRAEVFAREEVIKIVAEHIACNQELEATGWIKCDPNEFVFFRLTRTGAELLLDLVVDTENGAGKQEKNRIDCVLESGMPLLRKRHTLASFYVEHFAEARNEIGSLIFDFGNSSSSFVFSREGGGPIQARVVQPNNPFDPRYLRRKDAERNLLKSNMIVLRTGTSRDKEPWIVLGDRSEELIQAHPLASYLYAPKKYVRHWPPQLKAAEPTMKFRGIMGQREGLHATLSFVRYTIEQMLQYVIASLVNPHFTSDEPALYPQFARILLTYPLTWRKADRELFQRMVEDVAAHQLSLQDEVRGAFRVELCCSEPVAVAAYALWETFFHFGSKNLALAASTLGNPGGSPELRLLVVDIGGGSTDIAMIDVGWAARADEDSVDVSFKMLESMRFNRAGDRVSHLIATAIGEFLAAKHGIRESLDFRIEARNPAFTRAYKRQAVSRINELCEECKAALSAPAATERVWTLLPEQELDLLRSFEPLLAATAAAPGPNGHDGSAPGSTPAASGAALEEQVRRGPRLEISLEALKQWVESDRQSMETNGEPGLMDIFLYLRELRASLDEKDRAPHLVILSGRSTRLPFLKELVAQHLDLPWHRIRSLAELLPDALKTQGHENMDKLAVACGAQRFRFGDHIRFVTLPEDPVFNRYIGTLRETPAGLKLNRVFLAPGESKPRTVTLALEPSQSVRLGHAFRAEGSAQVIAEVSNLSSTQRHEVELSLLDDYSVTMSPHAEVTLWEWVPGGTDIIVDNFNDTGRIDCEPPGFLRRIVLQNQEEWIADRSPPRAGSRGDRPADGRDADRRAAAKVPGARVS